MKRLILFALFALLASTAMADTPPDLAQPALELEASPTPKLADTSCPSQEINLAPLAWEIETAAGGTTFNCGGRACLACTMCCNAACGWLDPCNEACWQQHCAAVCP